MFLIFIKINELEITIDNLIFFFFEMVYYCSRIIDRGINGFLFFFVVYNS